MDRAGNNKLMHHYLLKVIEFGPLVIGDLLAQIDQKDWDAPTHPDRFSPREVVAHLRYWEPVARGRIQLALEQSGAEVPNWDEEQDVIDNDYAGKDPHQMLAEWQAERTRTVEMIRSIPKDKLGQYVVHGMWGQITLNDLANLAISHDMYHVEQLSGFIHNRF